MALTYQATRRLEPIPDGRSASALLMTEVNHRVANSLQIASSILLLRARRSTLSEVATALADAATRISAVALLHRRLCSSDSMDEVNLPEYLQDLCSEIGASTAGGNGAEFRFTGYGTGPINVGSDAATQIGLIVTELATNSAKYGGSKPLCEVELFAETYQLKIVVSDNGPGLPAHYRWQDGEGVGLRLVQSLAGQLRANIEVVPSTAGASFVITMPRTAVIIL